MFMFVCVCLPLPCRCAFAVTGTVIVSAMDCRFHPFLGGVAAFTVCLVFSVHNVFAE